MSVNQAKDKVSKLNDTVTTLMNEIQDEIDNCTGETQASENKIDELSELSTALEEAADSLNNVV